MSTIAVTEVQVFDRWYVDTWKEAHPEIDLDAVERRDLQR